MMGRVQFGSDRNAFGLQSVVFCYLFLCLLSCVLLITSWNLDLDLGLCLMIATMAMKMMMMGPGQAIPGPAGLDRTGSGDVINRFSFGLFCSSFFFFCCVVFQRPPAIIKTRSGAYIIILATEN